MKVGNLRDTAVSGGFWLAWLLLAAALLIPAPTAGFLLAFLTVTCAVLPLAFGNRRQRLGALVALVAGVALAASLAQKAANDPYFKKDRAPSHQTG